MALRRSARYGVLFALALGCGGVHRDRATGSGGAAGSDGTAGLGGGAAMGGAAAGGDAGRGGIGTAGASGGGASGSGADGGAVTDDAGAGGAVVQPRSVALASSSWDVRLALTVTKTQTDYGTPCTNTSFTLHVDPKGERLE